MDISEKLLQAKLTNLVNRIKTCAENSIVFNEDVTDLMNRLVSQDQMVPGEIQVIEAHLDTVTDYNGRLLAAMTSPVGPDPDNDKVNGIFFTQIFVEKL